MKQYQEGYIAIASVIVISVVVLIIGTTVSILSVNDMQSALAFKKGEEVLDLTEGCGEDVLLRINEDNAIPTSIAFPEGTCSITVVSHVGNVWVVDVSGTLEGYTKNIRIDATRTNTVTVNAWTEQ